MSSPPSNNPASGKSDRVAAIAGLGAEVVGGGLTGAAAGFLIGGPAGSVVGGVLAPVVKRGLQELVQRVMSHREEVRVSAAAQFALERYQAIVTEGGQLRDDMPPRGDKGVDELLEGILQKARNSYQEKKVRLLGNILADFAFTKGVSVEDAHAVLVLVESLTYRQLVLLAVFQEEHKDGLRESNYRGQAAPSLGTISVLEDVYQLFLRGLVINQPPGAQQHEFMLGWHDVTPANMRLAPIGKLVCALAGTDVIPEEDRVVVRKPLGQ